MDKTYVAKAGNYFRNWALLSAISCYILSGCASSDVTRDVASNIDVGILNTKELMAGSTTGDIGDTYQNMNHAKKGALFGGAAGGVAGALTSSIGVVPGVLIGAVMGASYGSYFDSNMSLEDQLENQGVTIVTLGDMVLIVLPSARIFNAMSAKIKPSAYATLTLVKRYINGYTTMLVKITGYTDCVGSPSVNLALSQAQAESVARFLEISGVDARLLYAIGCGSNRLIQKNTGCWGESDNYRIEITLEKQYV